MSQILLRIAAGLGLLLIAVIANALLHGGGEKINPVAAAAERTQQTSGARLAIEAIYSSAKLPQPVTARATASTTSAAAAPGSAWRSQVR